VATYCVPGETEPDSQERKRRALDGPKHSVSIRLRLDPANLSMVRAKGLTECRDGPSVGMAERNLITNLLRLGPILFVNTPPHIHNHTPPHHRTRWSQKTFNS
jgi:hypothetical protein